MRQGLFEILVLRSNGKPFPEHQFDGKHYIAAEQNAEYKVKVVVHKNSDGHVPYRYMRAKLFIDGKAINYTKHMPSCVATFHGFPSTSRRLQAFVFTVPDGAGGHDDSAGPSAVGVIKVIINEAVPTDVLATVPNGTKELDFARAGQKEGKKFWQQPSLQTAPGGYAGERMFCSHRWKDVRPTPDSVLEVYYHTKDMVKFLKTFNRPRNNAPRVAPPQVHVDLSSVGEEPDLPATEPEVVDLMETGKKVKLEDQGETSAAKKPRASRSNSSGCDDVVDLTV